LIDFSDTFYDYDVESTASTSIDNPSNSAPSIIVDYVQSKKQPQAKYAITSLDVALGLVGGVASILIYLLGLVVNPFRNFRLKNTLIRHLYPTSSMGTREDGQDPHNAHQAKVALVRTVAERGKYWYDFHEFFVMKLIQYFMCCCCCCCCSRLTNSACYKRRLQRFERHKEAVYKLDSELGVLQIVQTLRQTKFLAKLLLRKHHRVLINSFRQYQLTNFKKPPQVYESSQLFTGAI